MNIDNLKNFDAWALEWLNIYTTGMVKDNSFWGTYHNPVANHLIPYFGNTELSEIRPMDVQIYFKTLTDKYSMETQRKIRAALKSIFDTAIENDLCAKNPITKNLRLKSTIPDPIKRAYTEEEYRIVWDYALKHPLGLSILLLLELGISRSELLGIRYPNINLDKRMMSLTDGTVSQKNVETGKWEVITLGLKTPYRRRIIPFSETIAEVIERTPRSPSGYLISSPRGKVYRPELWYRRCYKKFMSDLLTAHPEIPNLTPHELRHTRASIWFDKGMDLLDIAYLGGWVDLKMLRKRYVHIDLDHLQKRMKSIEISV